MSQPPADLINDHLTAYWRSQAVYVAAKLGLADELAAGPRSAGALAAAVGADAPSLSRLLRYLVTLGIFEIDSDGRFGLNPAGGLLQTDVEGSMRSWAMHLGDECYRAWGALLTTVRTGEPGFDTVFGTDVFDFYARNPESGRIFADALSRAASFFPAVATGWDFARASKVVDVGGGGGGLLESVLREHPHLKGVLFDRPAIVRQAAGRLLETELAPRLEIHAGDFFEAVPAGGDVYVLARVLHDWSDADAVRILEVCRQAMNPGASLLVVERLLRDRPQAGVAQASDVHMMVVTGGRERTAGEYEELLTGAGLRPTARTPVIADIAIIEARR